MSDITTYEDLEKRIKAIENKLLNSLPSSNAGQPQSPILQSSESTEETLKYRTNLINEMWSQNGKESIFPELLHDSAIGFAELSYDADIYEYIAKQLSRFCNDSIVLINYYDKSSYSLLTKALAENGELKNPAINKLLELFNEKSGQSLPEASFELSEQLTMTLLKGQLIKIDNGLNELVFNMISKADSLEIAQILKIKSTWVIGFGWNGEIYGNAVILTDKYEINNSELVEIFARLCALALQRRHAEDALQESKEYLSVSLKCLADGVITTNKSENIVYLNPVAEQLCGWNLDNAKGRHLKDVFKIFENGGQSPSYELQNPDLNLRSAKLISKSGDESLISYTASPINNNNGDVIGEIIAFKDNTGQKKYVDNIKSNEEKYKQLIGNVPIAVVSSDTQGNIGFVNDYMLQLLGSPSAEETKSINLFTFEPLVKAGVSDKIKECINSANPIAFECNYYTKWGKSIYVKASFIALKDSNDIVSGVLISAQDLTMNKIQERELLEAKLKAEQADSLKSTFLANMSHEIRSPMNAIIGFSSLLTDENLTQKDRNDYVNLINISCNNLSNLINDIIDIAKIEAGQIKINKVEFNVLELLDEIYNVYDGTKRRDDRNKIELRLNKNNIHNALLITSDPYRLKQVLINLIGNAFKFTEEGFIEFGVKIKDENTLLFYVQDTGRGIKPHELQIIFDRFRQSEDNDVTKHAGTGLGLSISKNIAKLLGGIMWVESEFKHGSTFYFTLPCKAEEVSTEAKEIRTQKREEFDWSDKTVLIVEDVEINCLLIKEYLRKTKVKIQIAKDGQEGIEMCKSNENIDLVLMDIQLPVVNGYVATRKIKEFRPFLPIVAETAYAMASEKHEILKAGCDDYLAKPLKSEELINVMSKYINIRKSYQN